ncbi:2 TMS putative copper chaperone [Rhodopseudomonas palustris]|nr:2 TMS putative copper chaperone [Rhodopseudomonas palustris]
MIRSNDHTSAFVSVLPGRIRLRHRMLRDRSRYAALDARLRALAAVDGDPAVGSFLLRYDPADTAMEARIRAEVAAVWPTMASDGPQNPPAADAEVVATDPIARLRRRAQTRSTINRLAKVGALAGMTGTVAALGVSRKLHAQMGIVAIAATLTHLAVHWRRTFR